MTHPLPGRADESAGEHHGGEALLEMLRRAECAPGSEVLGRLSELLGPPQRTEAPADGQTTSGASRTMALSADRGIINTGCVHGGQHVTDVKVAGDYVRGADDGI
ncbi:hypothetical protein ACH427_23000 [Streptomyces sp. NPDC020379]|uniref:hypothetical protein n=1 Tax=Streptomyces sp. NPDC020379 TaxID=3365071 RepID=UPI0037BCDA4A